MGLTTEKSAKMQCIESGGLDRLVELLADRNRLVLLNSLKTLSNVVAHPQARQVLQADATVARLRELSETADDRLLARSAKQALDLVLWRP